MSEQTRAPTEDQQLRNQLAVGNGGSVAFPLPAEWSDTGLTKRELFAAMMAQGAMIGLGMLSEKLGDDEPINTKLVAIDAVKMADALLKELARG